jgi:hypothetical protein
LADATPPTFSLVGRPGSGICYTVMFQLIFFVLLKDFSKFTPMNAINEIELKLPQALFNRGFGKKLGDGITMGCK